MHLISFQTVFLPYHQLPLKTETIVIVILLLRSVAQKPPLLQQALMILMPARHLAQLQQMATVCPVLNTHLLVKHLQEIWYQNGLPINFPLLLHPIHSDANVHHPSAQRQSSPQVEIHGLTQESCFVGKFCMLTRMLLAQRLMNLCILRIALQFVAIWRCPSLPNPTIPYPHNPSSHLSLQFSITR